MVTVSTSRKGLEKTVLQKLFELDSKVLEILVEVFTSLL